MYDKELLIERPTKINDAVNVALERFEVVTDVSYFNDSLRDPVGENLQNVDQMTNNELFKKYPQVDWKAAERMKDIDAGEIYFVCDNKLQKLGLTIALIKAELAR